MLTCRAERADGQILFLNKNDLFERKIEYSDIVNYFPVRPSRRPIAYQTWPG